MATDQARGPEAQIDRRAMLQLLGAAPAAAAAIAWTDADVAAAQLQTRQAQQAPGAAAPAFFSAHEYATVTLLADTILPADDRSGSASDAGVPVFIDFMMIDQPQRQVAMRGGLAWIDREMQRRFDTTFVAATEAQRHALLDDISGPDPMPDGLSHGAAFFRSFRDLTATGLWTSKMGMDDLQFLGNKVVAKWEGCPPEALAHLGVTGE